MPDIDELQDAALRFTTFVGSWPTDSDPASGLSKADADVIGEHVDRVVMHGGRHVPPMLLVPEDPGTTDAAFDHLGAFARAWDAGRIDAASQLGRADLDLLVATRSDGAFRPLPGDGPPDIFDGAEMPPQTR